MNLFKRPTTAALLLLISASLSTATVAQQRRQTPARPQPKAAPTPAPTFDTLIATDTYNVYGEIRGVGQLIRSSAATDILDPILRLGAPPKEFKKLLTWLNAHADELMTSRLLVATWSATKNVPEAVIAIEFESAEEATKFAGPLNQFLPTILSSKVVEPGPGTNPVPPKPNYYFQQAGSLVLLTPSPLNLKKLKPAGSKLLSEDLNFRAARNRFNSEPVFVFIDMKSIQRQDAERQKQMEEDMRKEAELARKMKAAAEQEAKKDDDLADAQSEEQVRDAIEAEEIARQQQLGATAELNGEVKEPPPPDPVTVAFEAMASSFFGLQAKWPEGIGLALSIENDSFDLRALFLNQPGEKSDAVPFMPMLIPGQPFVPESPNILPADTELYVSMSLDLAQIYTLMSRPRPNSAYQRSSGNITMVHEEVHESPFAAIEKKLQLNLRDEVLPMLGSEVAIRLPIKDFNLFGLARPGAQKPTEGAANVGPVLLFSLKDKEGVRALMPKIVDAMGFKGASAFAQTERRDDTEIVSFANFFSYAFVGNFLVLSNDPATTRYVVESYLKRETLAGDTQFKNSTRWQPRPAQGQVYISPALMESYRSWVQQATASLSEQSRAFLTRLTEMSQPITYSLSNEGLGPLHEVRLPKNLVLMAVVGFSSESNPPPTIVNERAAMGRLYALAYAQHRYKEELGNGSYATMDQLVATKTVDDAFQPTGYKFEMTVTGDKFEVTAVPVEYGKSGTMSYFIDQTLILRGGDRNGAAPGSSDPPIN
jgi:hypothetical protein